MRPIIHEDIQQLINNTDTPCVSIYMGTHRKGVEVNEHKDQLKFKNVLNRASQALERFSLAPSERDELLKPAQDLLANDEEWRQMLDTLVVFVSDNHFSYYKLPIKLDEHLKVSADHYILPLLPLLKADKRFYLLNLTLSQVHLYDVTPSQTREIDAGDLIPDSFQEVVGADYEQKNMQVRNQGAPQGGGIFHGHGEGKDDRQVELEKFIKAVAHGVGQVLQDKKVPLVLATVEDHFGEFKKVNEYPHLYGKTIQGNPEHVDLNKLSEEGWNLLESYFEDELNKQVNLYREAKDRALVDCHPESIIPASVRGKVDTLFVNQSATLDGRFDPEQYRIEVHKELQPADVDLLNLAAQQVFDQGGTVYTLESDKMPEPESIINAIYRYAE